MISSQLLSRYKSEVDGISSYMAGLPGYPRNFSRDTLIAGIIAADKELLSNQLHISQIYQGRKVNKITGEEVGKIHHEYPGVIVNSPFLSTYNACDTTALYLIGLEVLMNIDRVGASSFLKKYRPSIKKAVRYISCHLKDGIFWEFPPKGAKHFSLRTTYWKDSIVPSTEGKIEPAYPVAYALVQFQVARGLLAAASLLERDDLYNQSDAMFKTGIKRFMAEKNFCVQQDKQDRLQQPSSDELHSLAYIPKSYAQLLPLSAIEKRATELFTRAGIACTPQSVSDQLSDTYHGYVVWVFEQALIHYGCMKFGLRKIAGNTLGCIGYIKDGNELLSVEPSIRPLGNTHQLWSVAAKSYFSNSPSLRQTSWL